MRTPVVWFIRHGESEANAGLATSDPMNIQLTLNGWKQAEAIADSFNSRPSLVITSQYIRTQQTAVPTLWRYPDMPRAVWPVHEFTYLSVSSKQKTTIQQRRPLVNDFWTKSNPLHEDGNGAESFYGFIVRVQYVLEALMRRPEEFIAVFSHEQFMQAILWLSLVAAEETSLGITSDRMKQFRNFLKLYSMANGTIMQVEWVDQQVLTTPIKNCSLKKQIKGKVNVVVPDWLPVHMQLDAYEDMETIMMGAITPERELATSRA